MRAKADARGLQVVVGAPAVAAGLRMSALRIRHRELLVSAVVEELLELEKARVDVGGRGRRAGARHGVPIDSAGGAAPPAILPAKHLGGCGQEELLADHVPEVQTVAVVVSHHHVPVLELDLVLFFDLPLLVREVEEVELLGHRKAERLEATIALEFEARAEASPHVDPSRVAPIDAALEASPGL
jgi:hypothetical protein